MSTTLAEVRCPACMHVLLLAAAPEGERIARFLGSVRVVLREPGRVCDQCGGQVDEPLMRAWTIGGSTDGALSAAVVPLEVKVSAPARRARARSRAGNAPA